MSGHATMLRAFFSTLSILLRCCVFTRVRLYGHDSVLDSVYWIRLIASIVLIYKKKKETQYVKRFLENEYFPNVTVTKRETSSVGFTLTHCPSSTFEVSLKLVKKRHRLTSNHKEGIKLQSERYRR